MKQIRGFKRGSNGPNREDGVERVENCIESRDSDGMADGKFLLGNRCCPERLFQRVAKGHCEDKLMIGRKVEDICETSFGGQGGERASEKSGKRRKADVTSDYGMLYNRIEKAKGRKDNDSKR